MFRPRPLFLANAAGSGGFMAKAGWQSTPGPLPSLCRSRVGGMTASLMAFAPWPLPALGIKQNKELS